MKLKTWQWVALIIVVVAIAIWAINSYSKKQEQRRIDALHAAGQTNVPPAPGTGLAAVITSLFPFFNTVKK